MQNNSSAFWTSCTSCFGIGKIKQRIPKKVKINYQKELARFKNSKSVEQIPTKPKANSILCTSCKGLGIVPSNSPQESNTQIYPHIGIIGAGIGGVALAVALSQRGIPFTLFERDSSFNERAQGYGLTLQQASNAIKSFGVINLDEGIVSTRHVVHDIEGEVLGEWGLRKWIKENTNKNPRRRNIHIARQSLRAALLRQLPASNSIHWNHQFLAWTKKENNKIELNFQVESEIKKVDVDLLVGADGIRSTVRKHLLTEEKSPLRYLGCIVILGICSLDKLKEIESDLLDSQTVFQTANGNERIYIMPFTKDAIMWQLSFPFSEKEAKELSAKGKSALKKEAIERTKWHSPIPQIVTNTLDNDISGYPVYDREIISSKEFGKEDQITLLGDATHPMSPFKGQGANQALLDALSLARAITKGCINNPTWREDGLRKSFLQTFEAEMLERSSIKVKESRNAAHFLHSKIVLQKADKPRGSVAKDRD